MADGEFKPISLPYFGRRSKRCGLIALALSLVFLTTISGILPVLPGIIGLGPPYSPSVTKSSTDTAVHNLPESPGRPLPAGTVEAGTKAQPSLGQLIDSSMPPHLTATKDAYVYQSSYGYYSFNRSAPFIFTLSSRAGVPFTKASLFFVQSSGTSLRTGKATVLVASDKQFKVTYAVLANGVQVGSLTLQVDFNNSTKPKFTIDFSKSSVWTFGDFNIIWSTIPTRSWLKTDVSPPADLSSVTVTRSMSGATRAEIGPENDPSLWRESVTTDWSDAPASTLNNGPVSTAGLVGNGFTVVFPSNAAKIDPTQVSTSTVSWATAYSTQRKTFTYGGWYFVFFYDGSNIKYAVSQDGSHWGSYTFTAANGPISSYGFDVYQSGQNVALAWLNYNSGTGGDGTTQLLFRKGMIVGSSISWIDVATVKSWTQPYSWPPSATITSDGTYWAAGIWQDSNSKYNVWIYKSSDGSNGSFSLSTNYFTSNSSSRYEALELIPSIQGKIMSLTSHYNDATMRSTMYNPISQTWSTIQTLNVFLPTGVPHWNLIAATSTPDGFIHLVNNPGTYSYYNITSQQWTYKGTGFTSGTPNYLSISSDSLGTIYPFTIDSYGRMYLSNLVRGGSWGTIIQPFGQAYGAVNATWISAAILSSKEVFATWTYSGSSPSQIFFGSLPLPAGVAAGVPDRPWSKLGLTPYEQYFTQNGEFVSPGNGLLTVKQTDISAPGRNGVSLSIDRIYRMQSFDRVTNPYWQFDSNWEINLPWVDPVPGSQGALGSSEQQFVHFRDGEMFPLLYTSYVVTSNSTHTIQIWSFINHLTEDFNFTQTIATKISNGVATRTYQLVSKDGTVYNFMMSAYGSGLYGVLNNIVDRTGQNQIAFTYWQNCYCSRISTITDTIGRVAHFNYNNHVQLANVTYAGQIVKYGYGTTLNNVTDAVGRVTKFVYSVQGNQAGVGLLAGLVYPTGGNSSYVWGSVKFGTDVTSYYVTLQTIYTPGSAVKSSSFSYKITDGEITYANVTQSDGHTVQGSTTYLFTGQSNSMIRTVLNATQYQMLKQQFWYDPVTGRSVQQDVYSGNSAARSFYNSQFYDLWGNVIYNRDNIGHESYQSFANTDTQWTFQGPGSLSTSTNGKQLYDDFNGPSLENTLWTTGGSASSQTFTVANSLLNMSAVAATYGSWSSMWARSNNVYSYPFNAEVQMSLSQNPCSYCEAAELVISPQLTGSTGDPFNNNDAVRVILYDGVHYDIVKNVGGVQTVLNDSAAGGSWSVSWKIVLTDRNTLTVYLNRGWGGAGFVQVFTTTNLGLSTSFSPAYVYLLYRTTRGSVYSASFDYVGLTSGNSVTVNNLQATQKVQLYDWNNNLQASGSVPTGQSSITFDATQMVFPYGYFHIYELDGRTVQFTSATREIYGGSTYAYTFPLRSGGDARTITGYLDTVHSTVYVDDSIPSGATAYSDGVDAWLWTTNSYGPVASGTQSHVSLVASGTHEHYFNGSSTTITPSSSQFLIQYVYIPSSSVPNEIMLQFHTVSGNWEHRAYWGSNSITACGTTGSTCGTNGTSSRFYMGPLPIQRDTWIELIVKAGDVGISGQAINGWAYTLYDGGVYWDFSAKEYQYFPYLNIQNSVQGQKIELYDSTGTLKTSVTSAGGGVGLPLYTVGINTFPFTGYLKFYWASGSMQYSSPLMTDIWAGDVDTINQPIFGNQFNPGSPATTIHSTSMGQAQYQNATSTPEQSYSNHDSFGNLLKHSQIHNGTPLNTTYTYDIYGNQLSSINPTGETTYTSYSASFGAAYPTNVTRILGTNTPVTTLYSYNSTTGMTISMTDARGNITAIKYDSINRVTLLNETASTGPLKLVTMVYNDPRNNFTLKNEKGNVTLVQVDQLGRSNSTRIYQTGNVQTLATQNTTYTWLNQVKIVTRPDGNRTTYLYDYSGRLVKTTNPDGTFKITIYDDVNLVQTNYDENNHRIDQLYDPMQRLVGVREYYSATNYYLTSYSYDGVGNLAKTVDAKSQITSYTHDDLNRLTLTVFPDSYNETRTYDNAGNLQTKMDPNGNPINYSYDRLNRLTTITYPNSTTASYGYDKNNNRISLSYLGNSATFKYDAWNRLTNETWTISGSQYSMGYAYDRAGNLVGLTYPDNTKITYSVDPLNDVSSVKNGVTSLTNVTYSAGNRIASISYGNGVKTSYSYDSRSRPTRMKTTNNTMTLLDLNYTYDVANNVVGINTETYSYDYLNRLTRSTGSWPTIQYGYDAVGNRLWMYQSSNTTYAYGSYDRLTSAGSSTYTYDNNGNLKTSGSGTYSYSYDYENRLTQIKQSGSTIGTYIYSPLGQRIQKAEAGITTAYLNQGVNIVFEKQTSGGSKVNDNVYDNGILIAKLAGGTTYYFHTDILGSVRLVTKGSTTSFSSNYQPFGSQYGYTGNDPIYKYTGKAQDIATGLYYYGARYYDVTVGRFITRDPRPGDVNPYSYVRNNPETLNDPNGMEPHCSCNYNPSPAQPPTTGVSLSCGWSGCVVDFTKQAGAAFAYWLGTAMTWGGVTVAIIGIVFNVLKNGPVEVSLFGIVVTIEGWVISSLDYWCDSGYWLGFAWGGWWTGPGLVQGCNPVPWYF